LCLRKSKYRESERIEAATQENLEGFYNKIVELIREHQLDPSRIHNVDESFLDPTTTGRILILKGSSYYEESKVRRGEHMTLVSCITASGKAMRHTIIVQGKGIPDDLILPDNIAITATEKGWIDDKVKEHWFIEFLKYIENYQKKKEECQTHLLLVDGHGSNWSNEMREKAIDHGVIILMLPPHTTHILQPLDSGFFLNFKKETDKAKRKLDAPLTKWKFVQFLESPLHRASSPDVIRDSYKIAGVYPPRFKREAINNKCNLIDILEEKVICSGFN